MGIFNRQMTFSYLFSIRWTLQQCKQQHKNIYDCTNFYWSVVGKHKLLTLSGTKKKLKLNSVQKSICSFELNEAAATVELMHRAIWKHSNAFVRLFSYQVKQTLLDFQENSKWNGLRISWNHLKCEYMYPFECVPKHTFYHIYFWTTGKTQR